MWEALRAGDQVWQAGAAWKVLAREKHVLTFQAADGRTITTTPRVGTVPTILYPDDPRYLGHAAALDPEVAEVLCIVRLGGRIVGRQDDAGLWIIPGDVDQEQHAVFFHHPDGSDAVPHQHERT